MRLLCSFADMAIWTAVSIAAVFSIFLIAHVVGPPVNVNPEEANNTNSAEDEKKREVDLVSASCLQYLVILSVYSLLL